MSKILVVGNVMKDVYLNLDARTENFETDAEGVKWLNVRFDTTDHHFFRRNSSFGGAVISLEVLRKMGLDAKILGSNIDFENGGIVSPETPNVYRYILVTDDQQITYFTPSNIHATEFNEPSEVVDYIYIDRSVELTENIASKIEKYLDKFPSVKLAIYLKKTEQFHERRLVKRAELVFAEDSIEAVPAERLILFSDKSLRYGETMEPLKLTRPDLSTHLSLYSTAAATILGAYILGESIPKAMKLARANLENSQLDATLNLDRLETLAANYGGNLENLELVAGSLLIEGKTIFDLTTAEAERQQQFLVHGTAETYSNRQDYYGDLFSDDKFLSQFSGLALTEEALAQFMGDGRSFVDYLTSRRVMPGVALALPAEQASEISEKDCRKFVARFKHYRQMGARFILWDMENVDGAAEKAVKFARCCLKTDIVPVIKLTNQLERARTKLLETIEREGLDASACVVLH